jgi:N-formylglutamate amidohydrolase
MFSDAVPAFANTASLRVAGGLGTVPRVVGDRQPIYRSQTCPWPTRWSGWKSSTNPITQRCGGPGTDPCALRRIGADGLPFHALAHPHRQRHLSTDFVVGDRFGASCAPEISETIVETLRDLGFTVARNKPYAGGFITEHYGRPDKGIHAVQLEINRGLYMNERTLVPNAGFNAVMDALSEMMDALFVLDVDELLPLDRAAAE